MIFNGKTKLENGENPFIDTDYISKVAFLTQDLKLISGLEKKQLIINYSLEFNEEKRELYLLGTTSGFEEEFYRSNAINMADFADQGCVSVKSNNLLDDTQVILKAKEEIKDKIVSKILKSNYFIIDSKVNIFGLIQDKNNNNVGVVDELSFTTSNRNRVLLVSKYFSLDEFKNTNGYKLILVNNELLESTIYNITNIEHSGDKISITVLENSETIASEKIDYIQSFNFSSVEEYETDRFKFLSISNSSNADNDLDFDFDFDF